MKKIVVGAILTVAANIVCTDAEATQKKMPVYFKSAQYAGTGCAPGSAAVTGENSSAMSVTFSKYDAANPTSRAASGMQRTSCNFIVPVRVPQGYQISSMTVTWKGKAKGSNELHREYFIAGQRGTVKTSQPSGRFETRDSVPTKYFSQCGAGDMMLRINSSVRAIDSGSYISVGNTEQSGKLVFRLKWKACR